MRILEIHAKPVVPENQLDEDDAAIPGIYKVEVNPSLDDPKAASAALDAFHSQFGVEVLDDFTFTVMDEEIELDEDPDHEAYSDCDYGDVWLDRALTSETAPTP